MFGETRFNRQATGSDNMRIKEFSINMGCLCLHNKEQWDLEKYPLLCAHWHTLNKSKRLFCIGKIDGHKSYKELYYELIMAVGMKFPNETRHETALKYIINAEIPTDLTSKTATSKGSEGG